jgi:hypothetical protein
VTSIFSKERGLRTQTPPDALKTQRAPGKVQVHLFVLNLKWKFQWPWANAFCGSGAPGDERFGGKQGGGQGDAAPRPSPGSRPRRAASACRAGRSAPGPARARAGASGRGRGMGGSCASEGGGGEDSGRGRGLSKNSRRPKGGKAPRGKLLGDQVKYAAWSLRLGREAGLTTPKRAFGSGVREAAAAWSTAAVGLGSRGAEKEVPCRARQYVTNEKSVPAGVAREQWVWPAPEVGEGKGKTSRRVLGKGASHLSKVQTTATVGKGSAMRRWRRSKVKPNHLALGCYRIKTCRHPILAFFLLTMGSRIFSMLKHKL